MKFTAVKRAKFHQSNTYLTTPQKWILRGLTSIRLQILKEFASQLGEVTKLSRISRLVVLPTLQSLDIGATNSPLITEIYERSGIQAWSSPDSVTGVLP